MYTELIVMEDNAPVGFEMMFCVGALHCSNPFASGIRQKFDTNI